MARLTIFACAGARKVNFFSFLFLLPDLLVIKWLVPDLFIRILPCLVILTLLTTDLERFNFGIITFPAKLLLEKLFRQ